MFKPYTRAVILVFLFVYTLVFFRVANIDLYKSISGRDFIHGDGFSDKDTHSAALYFYDYGFRKTSFLPVQNYKGDGVITDSTKVYTHYPALPAIIAGITMKITHSKSEIYLRIPPLLISFFWFFLIFKLLIDFLPDKKWAIIAGIILVLSNYYIAWIDSFHKHCYEEFLKWLFVYLIYLYHERKQKKTFLLVVLALIFIIIANVSYEPILFLGFVTIGFSHIYKKTFFGKEVFILGFAAIIGFGIHFLQCYFYFHSLPETLSDLKGAFLNRTIGGGNEQTHELHHAIHFFDLIKLISFDWFNRIERFFLIPGWAFLVLCILGFRKAKKGNSKLFLILITLLIASLSWSVFMTQHSLVHIFITKQIGVFYALMLGYSLPIYFENLKKSFSSSGKIPLRLFHIGFLSYIFVMAASQQIFDLYIRYGFAYPYFGK
ncbi:MAG: hypothetical protein ABI199_00555 [Bacteroidia bacterium]